MIQGTQTASRSWTRTPANVAEASCIAQNPSGYPVGAEGSSVMDAQLDFLISTVKGCS